MTGSLPALRVAGLLLVAALVGVVALLVGVPSREQLESTFGDGSRGAALAFAGLYAAVSLSPLPKTVFTVAAGALFGVALGLPAVLLGANVGAVVAFGLARGLGRDAVARIVGSRLARVDRLLDRRGLPAVLAARLVPVVPFTAFNYVAGVTAVRWRDFVVGTLLGMVPATAAAVTIGAYGRDPGAWPLWAGVATLLGLAGAGLVVRWRRARRG